MQLIDGGMPFPGILGLIDTQWEGIAHRFSGHPRQVEGWRDRSRWLDQGYCGQSQALAGILQGYNQRIGAGEKAMAALERFRRDGALAVITGQQAGLLTGPLYTIHKALTTIRLARAMERELGRPVVPFFWIASEDHDLAEVDHCWLPGREKPVKVQLEGMPPGRLPIGARPLPEGWGKILEEAPVEALTGPYRDEILSTVRTLGERSVSLADWFARMMAWLFRDSELIFVDPLEPGFKGLAGDFLADFFTRSEELGAALAEGTEAVRQLGFEPPVQGEEGACHLFALEQGERVALFRREGKIVDRLGQTIGSLAEVTEKIRHRPEEFSPNVVMRPLLQDYLFPTMAYVAGPGEGAYLAQYKEIYARMGLQLPLIFPRASLSLLEPSLAQSTARYGLTQGQILEGLKKEEREILVQGDRLGLDGLFDSLKGKISEAYEGVFPALEQLDPKLRPLILENQDRVMHQVDYLAQKAWQKYRNQSSAVVKELNKLRLHLAPRGGLQERLYGLLPFLFRYGDSLINQLLQLPLEGIQGHQWVKLD